MAKNPKSTLTLGQARGVALLVAAEAGIPVFEYSSREVKSSVTGAGGAHKSQVAAMVGRLMRLDHEPETEDETDALAVAFCHAARAGDAGEVRDMISSIEGILRARDGNRIVVEIGGVGFEVSVPLRVAESLGDEGERVRLHTYLHVREDTLALYGFPDENERHLFRMLIGVSGVGPKLALSVLALTGAGELARIIHEEKAASLVSIPGIGKKTAERIVLELKDKIELERYLPAIAAAQAGMPRELFEEAVTALESIGLSRANAIKALERVDVSTLGTSYRVEDLVREALKAI